MATDWTIDRRGLFSGTFAALLGGALGLGRGEAQAQARPHAKLITAARIDGVDGGAILDAEGLTPFALPARAHAITHMQDGQALLVGRRPGSFAALVDLDAPEREPRMITPIRGHRFAGHAALSPDGRVLATSEIDAETGEGAAVLRDSTSGTVLSVAPVGIEPHDLLFAQGGARLIVAVGGIARAADVKGAPAINLGNIESAIVELDPNTGAVLKRHVLTRDLRSLSLRHMALAPDGETVAFGMQDQDKSQLRPVMGILRAGHGIDLLDLPADDPAQFRFYIGSVAFDASGRFIAATSPKGGTIGLWRVSDGKPLMGFKLADVCGLAPGEERHTFWATSGFGEVVALQATDEGLTVRAQWHAAAAFDNHLLKV